MNEIYHNVLHGDCLELMAYIPEQSIDMILCDLPYGTTACKWDVIIPFEPLWVHYKRIIKKNGAIVLFGSEPFSSYLRLSNIAWYKYDWVWDKKTARGHLVAKYRPMQQTENICVFGKKRINYYPIYTPRDKPRYLKEYTRTSIMGGSTKPNHEHIVDFYHPKTLLHFSWSPTKTLHPTQKPVELCEYLIKTYTQENELVLDNCAGSGTTGVACQNLNRQFLLMEKEQTYYQIIVKRLAENKERLHNA